MSLEAFNKLVFILSPSLQRNNVYSCLSTPISPIIIVGIGIWYLAGGELSDIRHVFGVSVAEAYNCIECFIESTLHCDSMRITLPQHPEEWDAMSSGFAKVSRDELLGVVLVQLMASSKPSHVPQFQRYQIKHRITVAIMKTLD